MISFGKKAVGLNISDSSIELVSLVKRGVQPKIVSLGRAALIPGLVEQGKLQDAKKLASLIKQLAVKAQPQPVHLSKIHFTLPESRVYCHVFKITDYEKDDKIDDLVWQEAIKNIPLPEDDIIFSYKITHVFKQKATVLLVAASRQIVGEWQEFFHEYLQIEVENFDIETLANFRGLFAKRPSKSVCVVDIGATTTNIGIFDKHGLGYVYGSNWAGDKLTARLAKVLNTTKEDAEKKKIRYGLLSHNSEMHDVLARGVNAIFKDIMEAMRYYHRQTGKKIHQVVLLGGSSHLKGLTEYLQTNLNLPVNMGVNTLVKDSVPLEYITAIGSAWQALDSKWQKTDPILEFSFSERAKAEREQKKLATAKSKASKKKGKKKDDEKPKVIDSSITMDLNVDTAEMEDDDFDLGEGTAGDETKKLRLQKIALIMIVLIGLGGVVYAFNFRNKEKAAKEVEINNQQAVEMNKPQTLIVQVLVATTEASPDQIAGRLVEDRVDIGNAYNDVIGRSRSSIQQTMSEGEVFWPEPLAGLKPDEEIKLPVTITWLIYSEKEANKLLLAEVDKLNTKSATYSLISMKKQSVIPVDIDGQYYMKAEISIMTSDLLPLSEVNEQRTEPALEDDSVVASPTTEVPLDNIDVVKEADNNETFVIIGASSTGFVNVRTGAGTNYELVGQVIPGDRLLFVEESNGWYKITLPDGQVGWLLGTYAEKVTE